MRRTLGIIGGMGPLATCDLYRKIVEGTRAESDGDHMRILIESNNDVPDRSKAILHGEGDPIPALCASANRLAAAGADFLVIACNVAHRYIGEVRASVRVPVLSMIAEAADEAHSLGLTTVGILATEGAIVAGIYERELDRYGIGCVLPRAGEIGAVTDMIYRCVKAGDRDYNPSAFRRVAERLLSSGAQALILGCTELPIAFERFGFGYPAIDPTAILARAAIRFAGYPLRPPRLDSAKRAPL